ncbi:MAG: 30S ribosomal protein S17 [Euryarchaeota archaeon]|nr:30S ribosomal protein S17 [Euryarchaeota archaeon]MDE1835730.1 30S ribosomal protein S17 [Euryarchaeota archaeon]MDE1880845.1 30S ribosomal protein S17 [Euryarchaeota archaeon]MDE2043921.1 30S ribosomal protein S17 [Thermoplasmata archaeon]
MTGSTPRAPRTPSPRPASAPAPKKPRPATKLAAVGAASPAVPRAPATKAARDIGLDVRLPKTACHDLNCPFHGHLKVRGQVIEGEVVSDHMQGTVVVSRTVLRYVSKFERYEKRRRRYLVHAPPCLGVRSGRRVRIAETRPLAKNVSFVVVEDLGDARREIHGEEAAAARAEKSQVAAESAVEAKTAQEKLEAASAPTKGEA